MSQPLISLKNFTFQYREQSSPTLKNISLDVYPGEKIAIVGPSGCGKSTLVSVLNGLIPHHYSGEMSGTVHVAGMDPAKSRIVDIATRVGTVLQDMSSQFVGLTVAEDIAFALENRAVPRADMSARIEQAASIVGMSDKLASAPQDLSGGQKQRVAMAGVLVEDVDILLFDEPLAQLDPVSGRRTIELIDDLNRDGKTIIIVEHRLEDVLHREIDRIILMDNGEIIADATPSEIIADGLLEQHGIRPPLHVAALRYAGVALTASSHPENVATMELSGEDIAKVCAWFANVVEPQHKDPQPDQSYAVATRNLTVTYPPQGDIISEPVLRNITREIIDGSMISIVGSNGAGKSSLAGAICGFVPTTAGDIFIDGERATDWTLAQRGEKVGFVLQDPHQMLSEPLVIDELMLGLKARGVSAEIAQHQCEQALRVCGLWQHRKWPVAALSHGQKKRVTIAIMLALGPNILILDEPTSGQDFAHYTEFMDFLKRLNHTGVTVVLITHDMHLALEYSQRVLVISGGEIIADDTPARVLTNPDITTRADLTMTGLHELARRCGISDPAAFAQYFVDVDQRRRARAEETRL